MAAIKKTLQSKPTTQSAPQGFFAVSFNTEDFTSGGLPSDFWGTPTSMAMVAWTAPNAKGEWAGRYSLMLETVIKCDDENVGDHGTVTSYDSVGWLDKHVPSEDGVWPAGLPTDLTLDEVRGIFKSLSEGTYTGQDTPEQICQSIRGPFAVYIGNPPKDQYYSEQTNRMQLDKNSKSAQLFRKWEELFKERGLTRDASLGCGYPVGLHTRFVRMPYEKADGTRPKPKKDAKYEVEVLLPMEIDVQGQTAKGNANTSKSAGSTSTSTSAKSTPAVSTPVAVDDELSATVLAIAAAALDAGETVTLSQIKDKILAEAKANGGVGNQLKVAPKLLKLLGTAPNFNTDLWDANGLTVNEKGEISIAE